MGVNHQNAVNSFKGFFKEEEPNLEEITSEEIQELINACTNDRDRLLIAMMAETGLRLGKFWESIIPKILILKEGRFG